MKIFKQVMLARCVDRMAACYATLFTAGVQQGMQLRWLRQAMSPMGARAPSHPEAVVGFGIIRNLMQEVLSKTSSAKSPQLLLTSRAGVRQWAQLGGAFWLEGSLAHPGAASIVAAQVRPDAWCHSFKEVALVRGGDHLAACESPLVMFGVQRKVQLRCLRQPISQMGARVSSNPKAVALVGKATLLQAVFSKFLSLIHI